MPVAKNCEPLLTVIVPRPASMIAKLGVAPPLVMMVPPATVMVSTPPWVAFS